jgi:hypothetical protein
MVLRTGVGIVHGNRRNMVHLMHYKALRLQALVLVKVGYINLITRNDKRLAHHLRLWQDAQYGQGTFMNVQ